MAERSPSDHDEHGRTAVRSRDALDLGQRHAGQSSFRRDLLASAAEAPALSSCNPLFSGAGDGGQSFYWNGIFLFFRSQQLRRLGGCDSRSATALDVAAWPCRPGHGFVLRLDAAGSRAATTVSERRAASVPRAMLDA